jgi:hypothetical protein
MQRLLAPLYWRQFSFTSFGLAPLIVAYGADLPVRPVLLALLNWRIPGASNLCVWTACVSTGAEGPRGSDEGEGLRRAQTLLLADHGDVGLPGLCRHDGVGLVAPPTHHLALLADDAVDVIRPRPHADGSDVLGELEVLAEDDDGDVGVGGEGDVVGMDADFFSFDHLLALAQRPLLDVVLAQDEDELVGRNGFAAAVEAVGGCNEHVTQ